MERKRDGFDIAWGKKTRGKCWETLVTICGTNGYALKPLNGDHERVADDRSLRRALQKANGDVDVIVATQPSSHRRAPCPWSCGRRPRIRT